MSTTPASSHALRSCPQDFDFLHGSWHVAHRRLKERWVGCEEWDLFQGTSICWPLLAGVANVDEIAMPDRGFSGLTLRSYDLERGLWSLRWINSTRGVVEPPVAGHFEGGRGVFEGDDTDGGRPIRVRFLWDAITPVSARWTQAFSDDGGQRWETNWIMQFTRTEASR
ncbi:hypothetical protein [Salinarimonas soli]|uniref:DUF1579 domain-containing protein n=1 Tax=Salinarimonas soli TaxID=1638099 RepID=A0A5B2V8G8_9HYPH|nr:hypothetical protein [Salinarimonas soli]KAA2234750.1 hypothetical protein F0L46_23050 [Salinarimonas soli]